MKIRLLAFDFDNCLFNKRYIKPSFPHYHNVLAANRVFLDTLRSENNKFDKIITWIASARQSKKLDYINSRRNKTESCFVAIQTVTDYLEATLDKFLMADLYSNSVHGTAFDRAIALDHERSHFMSVFDETKFTLLYAQTHRVALAYPEDEIIFDFYDDRNLVLFQPTDILGDLKNYFARHPTLLPKNVTLRLHHYDGDYVTSVATIRGTGETDEYYRETILDITKASTIRHKRDVIKKDMLSYGYYITPMERPPSCYSTLALMAQYCGRFFSRSTSAHAPERICIQSDEEALEEDANDDSYMFS